MTGKRWVLGMLGLLAVALLGTAPRPAEAAETRHVKRVRLKHKIRKHHTPRWWQNDLRPGMEAGDFPVGCGPTAWAGARARRSKS